MKENQAHSKTGNQAGSIPTGCFLGVTLIGSLLFALLASASHLIP